MNLWVSGWAWIWGAPEALLAGTMRHWPEPDALSWHTPPRGQFLPSTTAFAPSFSARSRFSSGDRRWPPSANRHRPPSTVHLRPLSVPSSRPSVTRSPWPCQHPSRLPCRSKTKAVSISFSLAQLCLFKSTLNDARSQITSCRSSSLVSTVALLRPTCRSPPPLFCTRHCKPTYYLH